MSTTIASWIRKLSLCTFILGCQSYSAWGNINQVRIIGDPQFDRNTERVTLRLKVVDENQRPIDTLEYSNFSVFVNQQSINFPPQNFQNPTLATPPPTRIIVLLDMSGSMNKPASTNGSSKTKLEASIEAIRTMVDQAASKNSEIKIALVPFGQKGAGVCTNGVYEVDETALNNFHLAGSEALKNELKQYENKTPCAATNLYEPLKRAIAFFSDGTNEDFYPPLNSDNPQPRLAIILLTDGYHSTGGDEQYQQDLEAFLSNNSDLSVFTLGYGLSPQELQNKYQGQCDLKQPPTRADFQECSGLSEEFVEREPLEKIADWGNGFSEFSGNPDQIAQNFLDFLKSILGEYQITYSEPNPNRGQTNWVHVTVKDDQNTISAKAKKYTVDIFGRTPPREERIIASLATLGVLGMGGIIPFYLWQKQLKKH